MEKTRLPSSDFLFARGPGIEDIEVMRECMDEAQRIADSHGGAWVICEDLGSRSLYILPADEAAKFPGLLKYEALSPRVVVYGQRAEWVFGLAMLIAIPAGLWGMHFLAGR